MAVIDQGGNPFHKYYLWMTENWPALYPPHPAQDGLELTARQKMSFVKSATLRQRTPRARCDKNAIHPHLGRPA
jgi:hypothetical protein